MSVSGRCLNIFVSFKSLIKAFSPHSLFSLVGGEIGGTATSIKLSIVRFSASAGPIAPTGIAVITRKNPKRGRSIKCPAGSPRVLVPFLKPLIRLVKTSKRRVLNVSASLCIKGHKRSPSSARPNAS